jgi:ParB family transcriptional regulator, chromosome partitioning protein
VKVDINSIVIRKRIRKNLGDLNSLSESLRKHGLMNPVVINSKNELIAGHRRLEAAKKLGWSTIDVRVADGDAPADLIEMELDENTQRKNLTTDELADAYIRLDRLRNPGFFRRLWLAITTFFRRLFGRR